MIARGTTRRVARGGFSLLEVLITATILGSVLASIGFVAQSAADAQHEDQVRASLDTRAHRTIAFLADELVDADSTTLVLAPGAPFGATAVDYRRPSGSAGSALQWGDACRLRVLMQEGELDDGVDNDGNGLVDERMLVWTQDVGLATERDLVRARWIRELLEGEIANGVDDNGNGLIDEPGLCFELVGDVLTIRLSMERTDREGRSITRSVETSIRLWN